MSACTFRGSRYKRRAPPPHPRHLSSNTAAQHTNYIHSLTHTHTQLLHTINYTPHRQLHTLTRRARRVLALLDVLARVWQGRQAGRGGGRDQPVRAAETRQHCGTLRHTAARCVVLCGCCAPASEATQKLRWRSRRPPPARRLTNNNTTRRRHPDNTQTTNNYKHQQQRQQRAPRQAAALHDVKVA